MSHPFVLPANPLPPERIAEILQSGGGRLYDYLGGDVYVNSDPDYLKRQCERLAATALAHAQRVGDEASYLLRAPGRLNAFLEYLDMCAGDHMSTTIDGDIPLAITVRNDDKLVVSNTNPLFQAEEVSITDSIEALREADWKPYRAQMDDTWDTRTLMYPHHGRPAGNWLNYVLSPYMRVKWELPDVQLRGATLTFGPATAPFRAGTSSSSAIVVLSFLALWLANQDQLPQWSVSEVCRLLGEAEWYVGTHGGANDQMTILRNPANSVVYNRHSQADLASTPLPFVRGLHVVLANSLWEVNKTMGGNQSFNMRKGWIQMGDEITRLIIEAALQEIRSPRASRPGWVGTLIRERFGLEPGKEAPILESNPEYWQRLYERYNKFGSLHEDILGIPQAAIDELICMLPVKLMPHEAAVILNMDRKTVERLYTSPRRKIGGYHLRTTARFFHRENQIGRVLESIFLEAEQRVQAGDLSVDSPEYDAYRLQVGRMVDELQDALSFDFRVSNAQIDLLLTIARRGPGYLGGKLTGAGKGGCVSLLVRQEYSAQMCDWLDEQYYNKPERFEVYRQVLADDLRFHKPGTAEHDSAQERLGILNAALQNIPQQRRVITFSRGACALDLGGV